MLATCLCLSLMLSITLDRDVESKLDKKTTQAKPQVKAEIKYKWPNVATEKRFTEISEERDAAARSWHKLFTQLGKPIDDEETAALAKGKEVRDRIMSGGTEQEGDMEAMAKSQEARTKAATRWKSDPSLLALKAKWDGLEEKQRAFLKKYCTNFHLFPESRN